MRRYAAILLAMLAGPAFGEAIALTADTQLSDTGHFRLSWPAPGPGAVVTVQESTASDFLGTRTIYHGSEAATVISGRLDGNYYYRIRAGQGPWSEPVSVTVRHHSLTQAFSFLALGALVFVATAALIISGHRRHRLEIAAGEGLDTP